INICAKTGTAENKQFLDGKVVQLKDHSLFVCFAPRENPKIVVAVIVENGGFGATWAGPMAYLMVEKYLTDSLRADRVIEADRIAAADLMPSYLTREQFKADSIRAFKWFEMTKDSSYIDKYVFENKEQNMDHLMVLEHDKKPVPSKRRQKELFTLFIEDKQARKKYFTYTA
ncbi:MAG: penicillin-binding transpeptidase domain-containing protein, partial [Bacteroidota bacterium]